MVAGCFGTTIVDRAKFGVAATDAGTNWTEKFDGKVASAGDADHDVAVFAVSVTMFALGGTGFTIAVTSSENIAISHC